jgi:hypothetical protein
VRDKGAEREKERDKERDEEWKMGGIEREWV